MARLSSLELRWDLDCTQSYGYGASYWLSHLARYNLFVTWLGCHNLLEPDGEALRMIEKQVRNMEPEERKEFLREKVSNLDEVTRYLSDSLKCWVAGEADADTFHRCRLT